MIDYGYGVFLGPLMEGALKQCYDWRNDYDIWRWCRQYDLLTWENHLKWFKAQNDDPKIRMYAIYEQDGEFIGVCGLTGIDHVNQRGEFSLYIGPEYQGQGLAQAALKTLCKHGFKNLNLNLIYGETYDGNSAAKTFRKLGFIMEGVLRDRYFRDGRFINSIMYSIKRDECTF